MSLFCLTTDILCQTLYRAELMHTDPSSRKYNQQPISLAQFYWMPYWIFVSNRRADNWDHQYIF